MDMRKRLSMQTAACQKQGISADIEDMDDALKALFDTQIGDIESRTESVIAQEETIAVKANLLRFISGIGPVSAGIATCVVPSRARRRISQPSAKARRTTP